MKDDGGIVLGIELSSRQGSVALLKDGELLAEKSWIAERVRHNSIFQTLENLIEEADVSYNDISLYAVGRGPGSFSGMRMSFAIAQALALPTKTEVRAVSSGAALALAVAREGAKEIAVVGDARRGQVWIGLFNVGQGCHFSRALLRTNEASLPVVESSLSAENQSVARVDRQDACPTLVEEWKLVPYEEVDVPEGTVVVSPEAERLTEIFPTIGNARFPHAKEVAALALMQSDPEPLEPLYMHPPVFIEPKYT